MLNRNRKTQALAMLLLTMTIATPVLVGMTAYYSNNQGILTSRSQHTTTRNTPSSLLISKWNYSTGGYPVDSSPAIADVDRDGKLEVLVAYNYQIDIVNITGRINDSYYVPLLDPTFGESPVVADLNGTGTLQVLMVFGGDLFCYNKTGSNWLWNHWYGAFTGSPAVGDVDGDGKPEVIVSSGATYGYVFSFNGTTGAQEWQYPAEGSGAPSSPTLADLNGDGKLEVLVVRSNSTGAYFLYCLNGTAKTGYTNSLWNYNLTEKSPSYSSPAVADIDNDGHMEVIVGSYDNKTYCISSTGTLKWSYKTGGHIDSSPTIADIDGDGKLETLIGSNDNKTYCIDSTGHLKWSFMTGGLVRSSAAVADIDGDKQLEVLIGSDDGYLYCLDRAGALEWKYKTEGPVVSSPAVADLDRDGKLEVVFGSEDGYLYCLGVRSAPVIAGAYPWPSIGYRQDIRHTGCITDSDKDGLTNNYEATVGTNPLSADTDSDGFTDYQEFLMSTNPFIKDWLGNLTIQLTPSAGNNATMPGWVFKTYGFTMVTTNATDVFVTSGTSLPLGVGAPPNGTATFLYLQITGTQINGTTGVALYVIYNRSLVRSLGIDESTMKLHRWNSTTSKWDPIPSTVTIINSTHGAIVAHLNHFSYFAVLGTPSSGGSPTTLLIVAGAAGATLVVVVLAILVMRKRRVVRKVVRKRRARRVSR